MFGLYATTGHAVSFLAPGLFALFSGVFDSPRMGIIGIVLVLLSGLLALRGRPAAAIAADPRSGPGRWSFRPPESLT